LDALQGLLEEYVLREGTDYGWVELTLDEKVARAFQQLEKGEVHIVYDEISETCNVVLNQDLAAI